MLHQMVGAKIDSILSDRHLSDLISMVRPPTLKIGPGNLALAVIASAPCLRLVDSIPYLAPLPLHGDAGGIADLDPGRTRTGSIPAIDSLGNDAFCAKPASVREDDRAVLGDVLVEQDAGLGIAQQARQRGLSVEERAIAQILAVMLDQVEGVEDRGAVEAQQREPIQVVVAGTE
jgi:hypothetical protein